MGGKQKQTQRTKGNTRPSSSARAAQYLQNTALTDGGASGGFIGFSGLSGDLGFVPAAQGSDEADSSVDAEFRFVLRKLSKRDATTKLKALQELTTLCQEKDSESVKTVLPFWPRIYSKISMDQDRRVREACQQSHEHLCMKVHRDLAPHLRSLIGAWVLAQCDPYAPASSVAKAAFNAAFPPAKQPAAIAFCKQQIFSMMYENVLTHTPQTLSDPKCTEPEDIESKFLRVVASSLSSLNLLLHSIAVKHADFVEENFSSLLSEGKFWKYAKHSSFPIASAFYSLISSICQLSLPLSVKFADKICPAVLHNLDNSDPVVVAALWECALNALKAIPDCWLRVNPRKGVLPKLWQVMRKGGNGSAAIIHPHFLPLLSLIPTEVKGEGHAFYAEFFGNLKKGLFADGVCRSPREMNAIVKAFVECLKFTFSSAKEDENLRDFLINELFSLIEISIEESKPCLAQSVLYSEFSSLLLFFSRNKCTEIVQSICDRTLCLSMKYIDASEQEASSSLSRLLNLLSSFHGVKIGKKCGVKFDTGEIVKPASQQSLYLDDPYVQDVVCKSVLAGYKPSSPSHLKFFCAGVQTFMGSDLLGSLSKSDEAALEVVRTMLLPVSRKDPTPDRMTQLVSAAKACFTESANKGRFLDMLVEDANQGLFVDQLLQEIIRTSSDSGVTAWFRGAAFGQRMIDITKKICADKGEMHGSSWTVLRLALCSDSLLSGEYLSQILSTIHSSLPSMSEMSSVDPSTLQQSISFVCKVAVNLFSYNKHALVRDASTQLLLALFMIDCRQHISLNDECVADVRAAWKQGVCSLVSQQGGFISDEETNFFNRSITAIRTTLLNDVFSVKRLDDICCITMALMSCLPEDEEILQVFLEKLRLPLMQELIPKHWTLDVMFTGEISLSSLTDLKHPLSYSVLPQCITPVAFYSELLSRMNVFPERSSLIEFSAECCVCIALLRSLLALNSEAQHASEFQKVFNLLETNFSKFLDDSKEEDKLGLLEHLLQKSLSEALLWSLALGVCLRVFKSYPQLDLKKTIGSLDRYAASCNTLQVIVDSLSPSQITEIADTRAAILMSLPATELISNDGGIGHLSVFRHCLHANEMHSMPFGSDCRVDLAVVKGLLTQIQSWREQHEQLFLFDSDMQTFDWNLIAFNREVAHLLADFVVLLPKELSSDEWDFVLCTLVSFMQTCHESSSSLPSNGKCQAFATIVFHLLSRVTACMQTVIPASEAEFPSNLLSEWNEFFSEAAYSLLLPLFIHITGLSDGSAESHLLPAICAAVSLCPVQHLEKHNLPAKLTADDDSGLPDDLLTLVNHFCPLLLSEHRCVQISAFRVVMSVIPCLTSAMNAENDKTIDENSSEKEKEAKCPPLPIMTSLDLSSQTVEVILHDSAMGETIVIEPFITEHNLTFGYLLTWRLLLALVQQAPSQLRAEYAEHLKSTLAVDVLMLNLFRLMPQNPIRDLKESLMSDSASESLCTTTSLFGRPPLLHIFSPASSVELQHLACSVYAQCLKDLPAVLRQWWNSHDRHSARIVEEYTTQYVSPILIQEEIAQVQAAADNSTDDNLSVKGRPMAREVVASFQMEEVTMELLVQLPPNFPLGVMQVETVRRVGVATAQWRNWMLQLTTFLMHQNGSIMDGLSLWKKNVDKRFEGIEDCMICFSVIHGTTAQVPKLKCRTCKKKYHSACLYKWFNSSNGTACPLCRNLF